MKKRTLNSSLLLENIFSEIIQSCRTASIQYPCKIRKYSHLSVHTLCIFYLPCSHGIINRSGQIKNVLTRTTLQCTMFILYSPCSHRIVDRRGQGKNVQNRPTLVYNVHFIFSLLTWNNTVDRRGQVKNTIQHQQAAGSAYLAHTAC